MVYKDKDKQLAAQRKCYKKYKLRRRQEVKERKKIIAKWFWKYRKKQRCAKCGENHPACLDFHHEEKKEKEVTVMVHEGYSIKRIMVEIKKCDVLCSNCHRKLHSKDEGS